MWGYAVAMFAIAVIAEAAGLGGVPSSGITFENILFIVLVLIFAGSALKRFVRRPRLRLLIGFDHSGDSK
jgi:uncharacterized membrane protein YtjA (UPF0391 family)